MPRRPFSGNRWSSAGRHPTRLAAPALHTSDGGTRRASSASAAAAMARVHPLRPSTHTTTSRSRCTPGRAATTCHCRTLQSWTWMRCSWPTCGGAATRRPRQCSGTRCRWRSAGPASATCSPARKLAPARRPPSWCRWWRTPCACSARASLCGRAHPLPALGTRRRCRRAWWLPPRVSSQCKSRRRPNGSPGTPASAWRAYTAVRRRDRNWRRSRVASTCSWPRLAAFRTSPMRASSR
mmetsp:Transcript_14601/g.60918  ORF Transcript_14601/g.60918 Transcript_14601/m.60918 type:complete len:238 (+) Transcript_14601:85-798(+)